MRLKTKSISEADCPPPAPPPPVAVWHTREAHRAFFRVAVSMSFRFPHGVPPAQARWRGAGVPARWRQPTLATLASPCRVHSTSRAAASGRPGQASSPAGLYRGPLDLRFGRQHDADVSATCPRPRHVPPSARGGGKAARASRRPARRRQTARQTRVTSRNVANVGMEGPDDGIVHCIGGIWARSAKRLGRSPRAAPKAKARLKPAGQPRTRRGEGRGPRGPRRRAWARHEAPRRPSRARPMQSATGKTSERTCRPATPPRRPGGPIGRL